MSKIFKVGISVYDELDIGDNILDVSYYSDYQSAIKGAIKKKMVFALECEPIQSFLIYDIYIHVNMMIIYQILMMRNLMN